MKINHKEYRTIWFEDNTIFMIDQKLIPHEFKIVMCANEKEVFAAIRDMTIRGAPAIGAAGCFGLAQACVNYQNEQDFHTKILKIANYLISCRPTAYDLTHGINHIIECISGLDPKKASFTAVIEAQKYANNSVEECRKIGQAGIALIKDGYGVLTHCNAGALATVDVGTALAPMRYAFNDGEKFMVYADETRPRLQGAKLTAFELAEEGIPHRIIADNAAGILMQQGKINVVITGADRVAKNGDFANKIGTYEKAVLAKEHNIPFYIAVPMSTIDMGCESGKDIIIEERDSDEVLFMNGWSDKGVSERVRVAGQKSDALNPAFDVTAAKYLTGIITPKGIIKPNEVTKIKNG